MLASPTPERKRLLSPDATSRPATVVREKFGPLSSPHSDKSRADHSHTRPRPVQLATLGQVPCRSQPHSAKARAARHTRTGPVQITDTLGQGPFSSPHSDKSRADHSHTRPRPVQLATLGQVPCRSQPHSAKARAARHTRTSPVQITATLGQGLRQNEWRWLGLGGVSTS